MATINRKLMVYIKVNAALFTELAQNVCKGNRKATKADAFVYIVANTGCSWLTTNDLLRTLGWSKPTLASFLTFLKSYDLIDIDREGRMNIIRLNAQRVVNLDDEVENGDLYVENDNNRSTASEAHSATKEDTDGQKTIKEQTLPGYG